jgi:tetratricopeptide (TPR) repeat protein/DNA-binding winged helix-turn-helix (wHTH) protein
VTFGNLPGRSLHHRVGEFCAVSDSNQTAYRVGDLEIRPAQRCVRRHQNILHLRPKSFELLVYLIDNRDRLVTKDELLDNLWKDTAVTESSLVQCVIDVRRVLGDDARSPAFIRTAPKLGYQFIAPVAELEGEPNVPAPQPVNQLPPLLDGGYRFRRWILAAVAFALIGLAALFFWFLPAHAPVPSAAPRTSLTVLYFENQSNSPELAWLRAGLTDMLITGLSRSPGLNVLSRQELAGLLTERGANSVTDFAGALRIAEKSGAQVFATGTFSSMARRVRIDVQLHDVRGGKLIAAESTTADAREEILTNVDLLAAKLASDLHAPLRNPAEASIGAATTNNLEAYRNYSLALQKSDAYHPEEAIALLDKAIALDPSFAMAQARIGYTYAVTWGDATAGKPYLERAFRMSSRLTEKDRLSIAAWYALANLDYPQAIREYRELLREFPRDTEAYARLGRLLRGEERYDEAIAVLKTGLSADSDAADLYNALGGIYSQLGRHKEAIAAEERYVALAPDEPNAQDSLALILQWAGEYSSARASYARALQLDPSFEVSIVNLGNLFYQMGRYKDALRQYEQYIRMARTEPERARGYGAIAWIHIKKKDWRRAEEAARNELKHDPASPGDLMLLWAEQGNNPAAGKLASQLVPSPAYSHRGARPPQRLRFYYLGMQALFEHHNAEALAAFQESLRHWPPIGGNDPVEDCLADAYLQLGRFDDAVREYQRVLRLYPGGALATYHLGLAYQRIGKLTAARLELKRFLDLWREADRDLPEITEARAALATTAQ